ncbi:MAG: hypothetical protein ACJ72T_11225 [Nitrososphaeraceae archaeon]
MKATANVNINNKNLLRTVATSTHDRDSLLERKIGLATEGLTRQYAERLYKIRRENALAIVDFISSMKTEINPSLNHIKNNIMLLTLLSQFHNNEKSFKQMTREDILSYLDKLRKPDNREKLQAMELFKDTHLVKLELLSNATTINSALHYIRNKQQQEQQQKRLALDSTNTAITSISDNNNNDNGQLAIGRQTIF